ncbi:MAG: hypothetical protein AB7Q01_17950 [Gammaproteobacteria bacterium]
MRRAHLWSDGVLIDLGDLPEGKGFNYATAVNRAGQVVGQSFVAGDNGNLRSFLWDAGVLTDLGDLPGGYDEGAATDINDAGWIVGHSHSGEDEFTRAFLWRPDTGMVDLNSLIDPADSLRGAFTLWLAEGINNAGQIVGQGSLNGIPRAFLATPVPIPGGIRMLVSGIAALCTLPRRRKTGNVLDLACGRPAFRRAADH